MIRMHGGTGVPRAVGRYLPAGSTAEGVFDLVVTPESAGWGYSSLRILPVGSGVPAQFATGDEEMILLSLSGGCRITVNDAQHTVRGRTDVFSGVSDFVYLPRGSDVTVTSDAGGVFALPGARASRRLPPRYGPASGVPVELRGAGSCSRQVNNFATPAAFETDKLIACEVLTPAANWSSYPPHKHDESTETESELEEIYYYAFRSAAPPTDDAAHHDATPGVGYQRVYGTPDRPIEILEEVTDGDAVLIPHGWHGPSIAAPSHHMYYLNVMAGPEAERAWRISDDPAHGWVRRTWDGQRVDPRLPFYPARSPAQGPADQPES